MQAVTWMYLATTISVTVACALAVWVFAYHMQLKAAEEHIGMAFHPELGWAIPPEIHAEMHAVATRLHNALDHLHLLHSLKVDIDKGIINVKEMPEIYRKVHLKIAEQTPGAWDEATAALHDAYNLLGVSKHAKI